MPPPVALTICLVFVAVLLIRDARLRSSVSAGLWLPTFLLLVLGSRPMSEWLKSPGEGGEGSWLDQAFYFGLLAGSWLVASYRRVRWSKVCAANVAITLFYLYFAFSVFWSDDPGGSFKRWLKDVGLVFVIAIIFSEKDPLEALGAVYYRCACVLIPVSVVFIRYYPDLGRAYGRAGDQMFTGITTQKNSLGEIVLVFGLFLIWDYLRARDAASQLSGPIPWDRIVLLLMGMWLLYVSDSKTAFMCILLGVMLIIRSKVFAPAIVNWFLLCIALALPFFLLFTQQFGSLLAPLVGVLGRDLTFTGRADVWQGVLANKTVNPLFGAGYFCFWGTVGGEAVRQSIHTPGLHSAHDGYLDIYLDGGLVGVTLLLSLLFRGGCRIIRNFNLSRYQQMRFAMLIVAIVYDLSESTFARLTPMGFTVLLVLIDFPASKVGTGRSLEGPIAPGLICSSSQFEKAWR